MQSQGKKERENPVGLIYSHLTPASPGVLHHWWGPSSTPQLPETKETHMLCLNSGSASFGGRIWRQITPQRRTKAVPIRRSPPNAAHKCGLLFPPFGRCTATILRGLTYPKILCMPKKKKKESRGVDSHFRVPGWRKSWRKRKYLVTQPGNAPKARPSHLTMADVVNKVSPKDLPATSAKARSFKGCRPWTETQQQPEDKQRTEQDQPWGHHPHPTPPHKNRVLQSQD